MNFHVFCSTMTEEQAQERSDRAALIPWVKFLWESYTQCLDLLRNNARLENLYHDIAQMVCGTEAHLLFVS